MTIYWKMISRRTAGALAAVAAGYVAIWNVAVVHASVLSDLAATMQPGDWKEVPQGSSFKGGAIFVPAGGSGSILEFTDEVQRDPRSKKLYILGCARSDAGIGNYQCGSTTSEDAKFIVYDEATNSWSEGPPAGINSWPHGYDHAALDPQNGDYYYREYHNKNIWRLKNGQWSTLPAAPAVSDPPGNNAMEYFPGIGLVVPNPREKDGEFYVYSPSTNSWTIISEDFEGDYSQFTEYNPVHNFLYFGGGNSWAHHLYKLDANKNVTRLTDSPVEMGTHTGCTGVQTIDPLTGKLVVFGCDVGRQAVNGVYEYDPTTNSWARTGTHPLTWYDLTSAAAPLPEYGVIFVASYTGGGTGKIWLYKHSAGTPAPRDTTPPSPPLNLKLN